LDRGLIVVRRQCFGLLVVALLSAFVVPVAGATPGTVMNFSSLDKNHNVSGTLYLPDNAAGPSPAIVLVHGTAGINQTGALYRDQILNLGIAVFEVDFKTGIFTSAMNRPPANTFVPMAFAALKELRKLPAIDPNRIGIMGFSMGGHLTVNTAFESNRKSWMGDEKGFAAYVAFYPICASFLKQSDLRVNGAPMIILYGTDDSYGDGKNVPAFQRMLSEKFKFEVTTVEYPGAMHDFNRNVPPMNYPDPAAIGGTGHTAWNADAANDSVVRVVDFLRKNLRAT
jgi:dienelactone hydrolase